LDNLYRTYQGSAPKGWGKERGIWKNNENNAELFGYFISEFSKISLAKNNLAIGVVRHIVCPTAQVDHSAPVQDDLLKLLIRRCMMFFMG
jgi:hypothetical protein